MGQRVTIKQYIGAMLFDVPRYLLALSSFRTGLYRAWIGIRNRNEQLVWAPDGAGVRCNWQWTSDLYLPKIFPIFGHRLYRRVFADFPIRFQQNFAHQNLETALVSFIIGHRGIERLPLLLMTLQSIAGQIGCRVECIVVEQDNEQYIKDQLPDWVRYIHLPLPDKDMSYSRTRAFNAGAYVAKSELLIFHDNDMLVPECYAGELLKYYQKGYEIINLKRFIFYFDKKSTERVCNESWADFAPGIEAIMQNAQGGGTLCVSREAFFDIGRFDEDFIGWGGEDNEFWERAQTRKVYPYGYLPIIHLWHKPQKEKEQQFQATGCQLYKELSRVDVNERIIKLKKKEKPSLFYQNEKETVL